jgi:hypothetical protein
MKSPKESIATKSVKEPFIVEAYGYRDTYQQVVRYEKGKWMVDELKFISREALPAEQSVAPPSKPLKRSSK